MRNFDPAASFGKRTAATYDDHLRGDEAETIEFLYQQARGGPVLELAIDRWSDLDDGCGTLVHLTRPRDLDPALGPQHDDD